MQANNISWIPHPLTLQGQLVSLLPLERLHFDELLRLSKEREIWKHYAIDGSDTEKLIASLEAALTQREQGIQYPFVIVDKGRNKIAGSTRFLDIQPGQRKLEIGWTWLHPEYWGSHINTEAKLLLLSWCFKEAGACRVQLKTDENNQRSRAAILKIGATFEGIFRNDMIRDNGTHRNSAYFSIIDKEWKEAKEKMMRLLEQ